MMRSLHAACPVEGQMSQFFFRKCRFCWSRSTIRARTLACLRLRELYFTC